MQEDMTLIQESGCRIQHMSPHTLPPNERHSHIRAVRDVGPIGKRLTRARARDPDVSAKRLERKVTKVEVEMDDQWRCALEQIDDFHRREGHFSHRLQFLSCPAALRTIIEAQHDDEDEDDFFAVYTENNDGPLDASLTNTRFSKQIPTAIQRWLPSSNC